MPFATLVLDFDPSQFSRKYKRQLCHAMDDALLNGAFFFQENTPIGASKRLKQGWDIIPCVFRRGEFEGRIVNNAPYALYGIIGRGPGKFPPFGPNSDLYKWALFKGFVPFLVAKKIAEFGTQRWISQENWVGFDRKGEVVQGGRTWLIGEEIARNMNAVEFFLG